MKSSLIKQLKSMLANIIASSQYPKDAILLDVRQHTEHQQSAITDAILLPLDKLKHQITDHVHDKNTPIVVYCASGVRAISARKQLLSMGYTQVINGGSVENVAHIYQKTITTR